MEPLLVLNLLGQPQPQERPVVVCRRGQRPYAYTPKRTVAAEREIRKQIRAQLPDDWQPLDEPLSVEATAYRRRPRDLPRRDWETAVISGPPDVDNLLKGLFDALGPDKAGFGVWRDDRLVIEVFARKALAIHREPGWAVIVRRYTPPSVNALGGSGVVPTAPVSAALVAEGGR
jgi:Holliday junction resolvase RusA-like endonuclease